MVEELGRKIRKEWAKEKKGSPPKLDDFARALNTFGQDLATVRTGDLLLGRKNKSSAYNLLHAINEARPSIKAYLPPIAEVLDRVQEMAKRLDIVSNRSDEPNLQDERGRKALAALARLYLDMERYMEAVSTVREAWVTLFADPSAAMPGAGDKFDERKRRQAEEKCRKHLGPFFGDLRNDLNHAGMRGYPSDADRIIKNVENKVEEFETKGVTFERPAPVESPKVGPKVFLNISNHPSSDWNSAQVQAAQEMIGPEGQIMDIAFPELDPKSTGIEYLKEKAREILNNVPESATCAMVQGEFVMTFVLVKALQEKNIRCFAASTKRKVEILPDGVKLTRFDFQGFREYPPLMEMRFFD